MIICLGPTPTVQRSMTFASLTIDSVNRARSVHQYASGKSTNVARVIQTLGDEVLATGFLGGESGRAFREDLDQAKLKHDFVEVEPSTRLCITAIDENAGTATELIEESKPLQDADYTSLLQKLSDYLPRAQLLVLSGTLPPGAKNDFYAQCVEMAGSKARVVLDAVGEPLLQALKYRPFVVKPNRSEVERTLGIKVDSENALHDAMRELIKRGAQWAVVTRGNADTLITDGKSFWSLNTPAVKVVSAIGSGDAFAGGLASALLHGDDVPQASTLGAACGSANAMTQFSGHLREVDVRKLREQIRITKIG